MPRPSFITIQRPLSSVATAQTVPQYATRRTRRSRGPSLSRHYPMGAYAQPWRPAGEAMIRSASFADCQNSSVGESMGKSPCLFVSY
jgi:hypothetical protein